MKRFAKMAYVDLQSYRKAAENNGSAEEAIAAVALTRKEAPMHLSVIGLFRDMLRKRRYRRFAPHGGHWTCIIAKFKSQKSNMAFIGILIALGGLAATVITFLYNHSP
ncbi:MAG: hypothetical protein WC378_05150 [Opitutaceae bacterium]|jgi:hypothetical protein